MKLPLDKYIIELESKIQILERENETLSTKAEENLLLNKAFEEINVFNDIDNLLLNTLESISILLNIRFAGLFNNIDNQLVCISSFALFSSEDTIQVELSIPDNAVQDLSSKNTCCLQKNIHPFKFVYPGTEFDASQLVIIPVGSELIKNWCFVFANDSLEIDLIEKVQMLEKIIHIISTKLERIFYQNELKSINEDLEKKVELRTMELTRQNIELANLNDELLKAKQKAEESDRLKTAFLQNMSHEIRTPMNAIMGFSGLLVENYDNKPKLEQFAEIIHQRCNDLLDIINDILDISKIESGQLAVNIETCNLVELFDELRSFFTEYQFRIGKEKINFNLPVFPDRSWMNIRTDKVKLKQILINLIGNAFKYTDNGTIRVECKRLGDFMEFSVSDTGIGIPLDKQNLIFERFTQIRQPSNVALGGTGLGLPIAKGLTELLGGKIWVDSAPDKETTFHFTIKFDASLPNHLTSTQTKPRDDVFYHGKTVLVVEDDVYNAAYLKEILIRKGFNIIWTELGIEAVRIALNNPVDIILMDIRLPDISGYEATKRIKQQLPNMVIIAQTAYAAHDEMQVSINAGCDDYITKPTKRESLLCVIDKYLNDGTSVGE